MEKMRVVDFTGKADPKYKAEIANPRAQVRHYFEIGSFSLNNLTREGCYRCMGWLYDYRPYLKKYLYKQYDRWQEAYAPTRSHLRKVTYGRIEKIIELK